MYWHWQKLNEFKRPSGRAWWHFDNGWTIRLEWHLFRCQFALGLEVGNSGDDAVMLHLALPLLFNVYLGVGTRGDSWLRRLVPDRDHEFYLYTFEWALWLKLWGLQHESHSRDPWWKRGVSWHYRDWLCGEATVVKEIIRKERVSIDLDGRQYHGEATIERWTWKYPRWFSRTRVDTWISMDQHDGLPHAGKGESGYDCGDDALCGWGVSGDDVRGCIASGIEKVMKYRKRYGNSSHLVAA